MDFNGDRRRIPLIEEPRRPPWMLIVLAIAGLVVVLWAVSNIRVRFDPPAANDTTADSEKLLVVSPENLPSETLEREVIEPVPPSPTPGLTQKWADPPRVDYPEAGARAPGSTGRVVLSCRVRATRSLENCLILSETPEGYGFGRSALAGAGRARVSADTPQGARVQFAVRFSPSQD